MGFAEIGRQTGVTRQAVYKALLKADEEMAKAFRDVAATYKVELRKVNPRIGMAVGYSQALRSRVILAYSPRRGMLTWYEYNGQCNDCAQRSRCLSTVLEEARRLGVDLPAKGEKMEPAQLAEEILRKAFPEGFS